MKGTLSFYYICHCHPIQFGGGLDTQILPSVIEFVWVFFHSQAVEMLKHRSHIHPLASTSHPVKLSQLIDLIPMLFNYRLSLQSVNRPIINFYYK